MAKVTQITVLNKKFPALTAADIAFLLRCESGYVRATIRRQGLKAMKGTRRLSIEDASRRANELVQAQKYIMESTFTKDVEHELQQNP